MLKHASLASLLLLSTSLAHAQQDDVNFYRMDLPAGLIHVPTAVRHEVTGLVNVTAIEGTQVSIQAGTTHPEPSWTMQGNPDWLSIGADGTIGGTAGNVEMDETHTIEVLAADGVGASFELKVEAGVTTVSGLPTRRLLHGESVAGQAHTSLPGASFSLSPPVSGLSIDPATGIISGAVNFAGTKTLNVVATLNSATATAHASLLAGDAVSSESIRPSDISVVGAPNQNGVLGLVYDWDGSTYLTHNGNANGYIRITYSQPVKVSCIHHWSTSDKTIGFDFWTDDAEHYSAPVLTGRNDRHLHLGKEFIGTVFHLKVNAHNEFGTLRFGLSKNGACVTPG